MAWTLWVEYLEKLAIVAFVLGALYFAARRLGGTRLFARSGRCLRLLESMMLSQHAALYIVKVGSRYFLLGSAAGGVRALAELAEAELSAPRES
jgi:flagellar protein FliO/FliZ